MDINIVVLYIMCFSLAIFFEWGIIRQEKKTNEEFSSINRKIRQLEWIIDHLNKILKQKINH